MDINPSAKNPLALIIEDDYDSGIIFSTALKAAGYETEIIQNGNIALVRLSEIVPTIVLLDLHMPYVPGKDILQHIRADGRLAETKVILTSADMLMAEELREAVDLVLLKPVHYGQLRDVAARFLPKK